MLSVIYASMAVARAISIKYVHAILLKSKNDDSDRQT